ncbi:hypothetical protein KEM54_002401 [Ascosphaera aggregata]|nr:hypothetical protein KEM54_002401 [Ascosphaera aggregata]
MLNKMRMHSLGAADLDGLKVFVERRNSTYFLKLAVLLSLFLISCIAFVSTASTKSRSSGDVHIPSPADYQHINSKNNNNNVNPSLPLRHQSHPIGHLYENQIVIRSYDFEARRKFWSQLHDAFKSAEPILNHPIKSLLSDGFTPNVRFFPGSIEDYVIPRHLGIEDEDIASMRSNHSAFRSNMNNIIKPPYTHGSRGIVMTVSEDLIPTLLTTLRVLRHTGSKLPVEVFLQDDSEYATEICRELLPLLKANCIPLSMIFEASPLSEGKELVGHQSEILAMLFSSFEEVLYLEADNLVLSNPDKLFNAKFFETTGLVIWPDFWKMTYNPAIFNVTSSSAPDKLRLPSLAPGQLLFSKRTHISPLILASYYNFYGPDMYYTLLSQAEPTEGYKETFIPAVLLLNRPFHFIGTSPRPWQYAKMEVIKRGKEEEEEEESAKKKEKLNDQKTWTGDGPALHIDPLWDFTLPRTRTQSYSWPNKTHPPGNSHLFLHARRPSLDPRTVLGKGGLGWNEEGVNPQRLWGSIDGVINGIGYDVEPIIWMALKETSCDLAKIEWKSWKNGNFCRMFKDAISELEEKKKLDMSIWSKRMW